MTRAPLTPPPPPPRLGHNQGASCINFKLGAAIISAALIGATGANAAGGTWTVSESTTMGNTSLARTYQTTLSSPTLATNALRFGYDDCLTVTSKLGSTDPSFTLAITGAQTVTTSLSGIITNTVVAGAVPTVSGTRNVIAGPVRTLYAEGVYGSGSAGVTTLQVSAVKCDIR